MEANVPKPFNPSKNQVARDWQIWKKEFLTYLRVTNGYQLLSEERRALLLQNLMGTKAVEAMENMKFDDPRDEEDMDILLGKFDEVFDPPSNEVENRYKFFSRMKGKNETIDEYIMDLKDRAKNCKFGAQTEKFIIDMIIRNMDSFLRHMTFKEKDIYLDNIIEHYKRHAIDTEKIKEISENAAKDFNSETKDKTNDANDVPGESKEKSKGCWRCNTRHRHGLCPANGKVCSVCNDKNHLDGLCRKESKNNDENLPKRPCIKCGTVHPYKQCPAFHIICFKCNQKGHNAAQCEKVKQVNALNERMNAKKQNCEDSASSLPKAAPPSYSPSTSAENNSTQSDTRLESCVWCGTRHLPGQCVHDANCSYCTRFPHRICFSCKYNPHLDSCYYKGSPIPPMPPRPASNPTGESGYCPVCKNNPNIFCLTCKKKKVSDDKEENFVKVDHSDIQYQTRYSQGRRPAYDLPKSKPLPKKKDDCTIS